MRASSDKKDPGYSPFVTGTKVWIDGTQRKFVITADEERRMAVVSRLGPNGEFVIDRERGEFKYETVYGHVRLEMPEGNDKLHTDWIAGNLKEKA